ncbi:MAG TPA: dTDP-4-dehydrorhamnose 3,5-epimerase [Anaerolineae bacterium]|nr:dTDP-4-dehydrorhamnose 3,5-epimerase [Anaerolineae bacterium]
MPFTFTPLQLPEVILIEPRVFADARGFFLETYKYSDFAAHGIPETFVQDNHSRSIRGVLRGLHFQNPPKAQGKLVRVVRGVIFDVAVDIRPSSPTFGQWVGETLSDDNQRMLYIPPGFAHGFLVLSDLADVVYKVTEEYAPELDTGVIWNDPTIAIAWPLDAPPLLSDKDAALPPLLKADIRFD